MYHDQMIEKVIQPPKERIPFKSERERNGAKGDRFELKDSHKWANWAIITKLGLS